MRKSISSFVLGLVFSLIGGISAYLFWFIFLLIGAFTQGTVQTILTTVPIINFITFVISFIGCFFCLWKARIGGIIMLVSSTISAICMIVVFVAVKNIEYVYFLFLIPTLVLFINSIFAICKKKKPQLIPQEIKQ